MSDAKGLTHIVGTFLIQAEGAFLNGAGTETYGQGDITVPKVLMTLGDGGRQVPVPYVSSQSWKRWLRDTFQDENRDEPQALIATIDVNKQNNTNKVSVEVDPVKFAEADIFGFMKAEKGQGVKTKEAVGTDDELDDETEEETPAKTAGKEKVKPAIRTSPFQASLLMSLRKKGWEGIDKGYVHPKKVADDLAKKNPDANATPLPYNTKFYNTQLQGVFGLAYHRLGVFRNEGDRIELDVLLRDAYLKEGKIKRQGEKREIYEMANNPRRARASMILKSLAVMRGGAKQAQFGTPVHPQVLIIAGLTSGNLIFNNLFEDTAEGPKIKLECLREILRDFSSRITTKVYVGIRTGYLANESEGQLRAWADGEENEFRNLIRICTPIEAVDRLCEELPE
jgi:CRISPR-associated protein Cst2